MDLFDVLTLIGGLCLFLFGMNVMGDSLERRAGGGLRILLGKLTQNKLAGFLTGLGVTAVIQSSSATTVMVVGFVNSGLMNLTQAISVIMGANVGTTVTAWVLSLSGISSDNNIVLELLKPTSFSPVLALIGTIMVMFGKTGKKKDTGTILLGFATLMFGMDTMSDAVAGLKDVPQFQQLFILFTNPIFGVLAGAVLTAIIQSSSASVGILQALSSTGQVTYGAAIPIIMGQNIGTCITAILSAIGANKNAKRAAFVHLSFNIIGTVIWLIVFSILSALLKPALLNESASYAGIAVAHSVFNIACTILLLPASKLLEKLALRFVPDTGKKEEIAELDERLLVTPPVALERCGAVAKEMAGIASEAILDSLDVLDHYDAAMAEDIRSKEGKADHYEDILGTYLVKVSGHKISDADSTEAGKLLKIIGDFERVSDHAVNVVESAEEMKEKNIRFTEPAMKELKVLGSAVKEIVELAFAAYLDNDIDAAEKVEPLEHIIDGLKTQMRDGHIRRLQRGECTIEAGFVWSDLLTNLERVSDHCSNIAICVVDAANNNMNMHASTKVMRMNEKTFHQQVEIYKEKYTI